MPVIISLLRAVNLGGHNSVPMERLRHVYRELKLEDPRTYVQSGNVVFRTAARNLAALAKKLEDAIQEEFGFHTPVVLRTLPEMRDVVTRYPFSNRPDVGPSRLLVTFLLSRMEAETLAKLVTRGPGNEELVGFERELFIHFPDGAGRSKLTGAKIEKLAGCSGTARNWNTVLKLVEMGEELERQSPSVPTRRR